MITYDLLWHRDLQQACALVERRLPETVAAALADVTVTIAPAGFKAYADAGQRVIRLRPDLHGSMGALMGLVAHEVAHIHLQHDMQQAMGLKSVAQIEREADAQVLAWGFDVEMEHRRLFYER